MASQLASEQRGDHFVKRLIASATWSCPQVKGITQGWTLFFDGHPKVYSLWFTADSHRATLGRLD
jgi:hypothetical protein